MNLAHFKVSQPDSQRFDDNNWPASCTDIAGYKQIFFPARMASVTKLVRQTGCTEPALQLTPPALKSDFYHEVKVFVYILGTV